MFWCILVAMNGSFSSRLPAGKGVSPRGAMTARRIKPAGAPAGSQQVLYLTQDECLARGGSYVQDPTGNQEFACVLSGPRQGSPVSQDECIANGGHYAPDPTGQYEFTCVYPPKLGGGGFRGNVPTGILTGNRQPNGTWDSTPTSPGTGDSTSAPSNGTGDSLGVPSSGTGDSNVPNVINVTDNSGLPPVGTGDTSVPTSSGTGDSRSVSTGTGDSRSVPTNGTGDSRGMPSGTGDSRSVPTGTRDSRSVPTATSDRTFYPPTGTSDVYISGGYNRDVRTIPGGTFGSRTGRGSTGNVNVPSNGTFPGCVVRQQMSPPCGPSISPPYQGSAWANSTQFNSPFDSSSPMGSMQGPPPSVPSTSTSLYEETAWTDSTQFSSPFDSSSPVARMPPCPPSIPQACPAGALRPAGDAVYVVSDPMSTVINFGLLALGGYAGWKAARRLFR